MCEEFVHRLVYDRETGKPKGYGFCEYNDTETAQSALVTSTIMILMADLFAWGWQQERVTKMRCKECNKLLVDL